MADPLNLPQGNGIGPAPERCKLEIKRAWDELVALVDPGFLIWRDRIWMELTATALAMVRHRENPEPEYISALCYSLKGLNLGPDSLPKLGFDFEWLLLPEDEENHIER